VRERLTLAQVERIRRARHHSILLFITDRCPVGCAHCSVDSRRNSPTIVDFARFEELVDGIAALDDIVLVGISGGEPFVERRGLTLAVHRLSRAEKLLVLYTSGVWARSSIPDWIHSVLCEASCVFLSTDGYHAEVLPGDRFVKAARAIREVDTSLVVQVIRIPEMVRAAESLLHDAFGPAWPREAELSLTPPLPYGRGASVFHQGDGTLGREFGPCSALAAPVVRYDGRITACCNEQVIMGRGPDRLRARCDGAQLHTALDEWKRDPMLSAIGGIGPGPLTEHPRLRDLSEEPFASICDLCWRSLERISRDDAKGDPLLVGAAALSEAVRASA
jgi:organic radical activating enzyme